MRAVRAFGYWLGGVFHVGQVAFLRVSGGHFASIHRESEMVGILGSPYAALRIDMYKDRAALQALHQKSALNQNYKV